LTKPLPKPADILGKEILDSQYGKEAEKVIGIAADLMHVINLVQLIMEEKKEKASIGLGGYELERNYYRTDVSGAQTSVLNFVVLAFVGKQLSEAFPDDPVMCDDDVELLAQDGEFRKTVTELLTKFSICEDATEDDVVRWVRHCASALDMEDAPKRYWAVKPVDTFQEMREEKPYVSTLCLLEDEQLSVSGVVAPTVPYDHPSRSGESRKGCPIFFAVKGFGAWTQHVFVERSEGSYAGKAYMKGFKQELKASEKIVRGHDGLWDYLGAEQLHISMSTRLREDIFMDAQRIGKQLGSQYPKFEFANSSLKYCMLACGKVDICWWLARGLFDKTKGTDRLVDHAAGCLIAAEAGADVADLDGKPIAWVGPVLYKNRGLLAADPSKVPIKGITTAVEQASETSEELYTERCEKRLEVAKMLKHLFMTLGDFAETDEERENAKKVMERGLEVLEDDEEMMKITQEKMNRDFPLLGEGPVGEDTFS